jgi:uncharacterized protein with PIN domain
MCADGGLMGDIHNILKAAFAEDKFLLKKRKFLVEKMYEIVDLFQLSSTINSKSFNKCYECHPSVHQIQTTEYKETTLS